MTPERHLAAILHADVVGYSRLMAEDEDATVRLVTAYREEVELLVHQHGGQLVDFTGDNFLVEFGSVVAAVQCAIQTQRVIQALNADLPPERKMQFRMGVHLGEVRAEGERLFGTGVNVAARIQTLAEPGGVCLSGEVHSQLHGRLDLDVEDLGEQEVKNIPDPVRVYRVLLAAVTAEKSPVARATSSRLVAAGVLLGVALALGVGFYLRPGTPLPPTGPPLTAIAVLPFDDLSPGGDQAWLANGMAEALTESLSRIEALRVPGRTATTLLKRQDADFQTIGEKLQVGSIVEGSVQVSGDDLRVTAQLILVGDGYHLWSARYDRKLDDVFEIQREISQEIAEAIRVELGVEEEWSLDRINRFARYDPQDVRAYEALRKGIEAGVRDGFSTEGIPERLAYYEQATEIDPTYAEAHAVIGNTYLGLARASDGNQRQENLARARAAIQRALELDNEDRTALNALADLSSLELNWEEALSRYRQALALYPKDFMLLSAYGVTLATVGQVEEAFVQMQRAVALEVSLGVAALRLGVLYSIQGDHDTALELFDRAIERQPGFASQIGFVIANSYHGKGMDTEALQAAFRAFPAEAELPLRRGYEDGGWVGLQRAALDLRLAQNELRCPEPRGEVMYLSATLGDRDRMFDCLELFNGPPWTWNPIFDPYRDDPRFHALLRKWNLEDALFASE